MPEFPKGPGLTHKLKDYLEKDVDPKYYLSKERLKGLIVSTQRERERGETDSVLKPLTQTPKQKRSLPERVTGSTTPLSMKLAGKKTQHNRVLIDPAVSPPICASDSKDPIKITWSKR